MDFIARMTKGMCLILIFILSASASAAWFSRDARTPEEKQIEEQRDTAEKAQRNAERKAEKMGDMDMQARLPEQVAQIELPVDTSQKLQVNEIRINGNNLITTSQILENMPLVYNASQTKLVEAGSNYLYDLRPVRAVIETPGQSHEVSARSIQGLTQYIVSEYQKKNYAGIYVYVPKEAMSGGKLVDGVLPINILEANVTQVTVKSYDISQNETEKGYLRKSAVEAWSPVKPGRVASQKQLNNFVNLLNLNPDRYVSAVVTQGAEPNSLAVGYNIYEIDPWHYFIQIDNAGTDDRQWTPRAGVINTNLLGFDDTFTAVFQGKPDSTIEDNYSVYGSYDFPIMGPRLRLILFAGYSEFDVNPDSGPFDFLGRGQAYGGYFRYNVHQQNDWFFDLLAGMTYEESKVTPSLFGPDLGTDLHMNFWNVGAEIHRDNDVSNTSFAFNRNECFGGSDNEEFELARTGTSSQFAIYNASMIHRQYLDPNDMTELDVSFRFIGSDDRLPPAKMTTFGGMYTVRGYGENEIVADGGYLGSVQYTYDLTKCDACATEPELEEDADEQLPFVRKLAPLVFVDAGKAHNKSDLAPGEREDQCLVSVGSGLELELGDNFSGAVYYGYPLRETDGTREGKGRVNVGMMMRW
jgi:hemolysin activation/secretion protein